MNTLPDGPTPALQPYTQGEPHRTGPKRPRANPVRFAGAKVRGDLSLEHGESARAVEGGLDRPQLQAAHGQLECKLGALSVASTGRVLVQRAEPFRLRRPMAICAARPGAFRLWQRERFGMRHGALGGEVNHWVAARRSGAQEAPGSAGASGRYSGAVARRASPAARHWALEWGGAGAFRLRHVVRRQGPRD